MSWLVKRRASMGLHRRVVRYSSSLLPEMDTEARRESLQLYLSGYRVSSSIVPDTNR